MDTLEGFHHDFSGRVKINNKDNLNFHHTIRESAVTVTSSNNIFSGTVAENIWLDGNENRSLLKNMLSSTKDGFLIWILNNLDANIEYMGLNISSGQQQKIAILRAILSDSNVILLDEFSANLDMTSRTEIWKLIKVSSDSKIIIFISHAGEDYDYASQIIDLREP